LLCAETVVVSPTQGRLGISMPSSGSSVSFCFSVLLFAFLLVAMF
jgi:hypothetical protein